LDRRFIASLHSQAAIIYRKPNAECALLGEKLSKAKEAILQAPQYHVPPLSQVS
jgi:hypothetical protein